jgi:hypothetical protein
MPPSLLLTLIAFTVTTDGRAVCASPSPDDIEPALPAMTWTWAMPVHGPPATTTTHPPVHPQLASWWLPAGPAQDDLLRFDDDTSRTDEAAPLGITLGADLRSLGVDQPRFALSGTAALERQDVFVQQSAALSLEAPGGPVPLQSTALAARPILAGVRLSGEEGPLQVSAMSLQVDRTGTLDHANLSAGGLRLDLGDTKVGLVATAGDPRSDAENFVVGGDVSFRSTRLIEQRTIEAQAWMQQSVSQRGGERSAHDSAMGLRLAYPNDRVRWEVGFAQIGDEFDAALGSVPSRGTRSYSGNWHHRWRPGTAAVGSVSSGVDAALVTDLHDRVAHQRVTVTPLTLDTPAADRLRLAYSIHRDVLTDARPLAEGVVVTPGDYRYESYELQFTTSPQRPLSLDMRVATGRYFTGTRLDTGLAARWRLSPYVLLGAGYEQRDIDLEQQALRARTVRADLAVTITPTASWSSRISYEPQRESIGLGSRLQWQITPGNALVLQFEHRIGLDGEVEEPLAPDPVVVTSLRWSVVY